MDLFNLRLPLLFLTALGCCSGNDPLPSETVNGVLGKNVTFKTTINPSQSEQFLTVTWNRKNAEGDIIPIVTFVPSSQKVGPVYTGRVSFNRTTCELQLRTLTAADSGEYQLSIVTKSGSPIAGQTSLEVLEPVSDVKISSSLAEAVEFNSTVVLTCSAKGSFLEFKWLNGSVDVVAVGTHVKLGEDKKTLTVAGVLRTDLRGPIYCQAKNDLEAELSSPFNLSVSYGPENIVMTQSPTAVVHKKGANLTLSCSATSKPAAELQWMLNGAPLPGKTGGTLALANLQVGQSGNYSCSVTNAKTKRYLASNAATVTVVEPMSGATLTGPTAALIAGTSDANLTCKAATGKATALAWTKDGQPLAASKRVLVSADKSSVTIAKLQKEDSGTYMCKLTNQVGEESASYKMVVNYGPESVSVTGPEAVEIHDKVLMICSVMSLPAATFTWKLNGTLKAVTSAEYVINNPAYKDSGTYTCEARNALTGLNSTAEHKLSVKEEGALDVLSGGAIAGIVIGVLVAVAVIAGVIIYIRRNREVASPY